MRQFQSLFILAFLLPSVGFAKANALSLADYDDVYSLKLDFSQSLRIRASKEANHWDQKGFQVGLGVNLR
jgi:hypothetical protein